MIRGRRILKAEVEAAQRRRIETFRHIIVHVALTLNLCLKVSYLTIDQVKNRFNYDVTISFTTPHFAVNIDNT